MEELLQNVPPYSKKEIDYDQINNFGNLTEISIETYCVSCRRERTFSGNINELMRIFLNDLLVLTPAPGCSSTPLDLYFSDKRYFFPMILNCAKCGAKHMYLIMFEGNTFTKVGQYPSFVLSDLNEVRKYKNVLSSFYSELLQSIKCYSQGMGVAAFVYLRRILEWLIDEKYSGPANKTFFEKLKHIEQNEIIIPEELDAVKPSIYRILSKGIHEYCEDECLELYLSVRFVVERILDKELEKKENQRKAKEAIRAIGSKLSAPRN